MARKSNPLLASYYEMLGTTATPTWTEIYAGFRKKASQDPPASAILDDGPKIPPPTGERDVW